MLIFKVLARPCTAVHGQMAERVGFDKAVQHTILSQYASAYLQEDTPRGTPQDISLRTLPLMASVRFLALDRTNSDPPGPGTDPAHPLHHAKPLSVVEAGDRLTARVPLPMKSDLRTIACDPAHHSARQAVVAIRGPPTEDFLFGLAGYPSKTCRLMLRPATLHSEAGSYP